MFSVSRVRTHHTFSLSSLPEEIATTAERMHVSQSMRSEPLFILIKKHLLYVYEHFVCVYVCGSVTPSAFGA